MLIENRIKKETKQIVVLILWKKSHREKLVIRIVKKKLTSQRFFRTSIWVKNNFVELKVKLKGDTTVNYKTKRSFNLQPTKNNYLRSSSKKSWNLFSKIERIKTAVQAKKSVRWMPWHWEPMKDAITCDKLRWVGNKLWPADFRMGKPLWWRIIDP